uniref:Si:ch211-191i18.2 n=1 Tax=Sinocyclocheilus anshuiensis TaxID=1608454 RepID=A0A671NYH4_9TELE
MISVCLAGALLLLPLCFGVEDNQYNFDYDSTQTPEYEYNSTFEYSFFSNASSEELEKFLMGEGMDSGGETSFTEIKKETDGGVHEEKPTEPTIFDKDQASQSTPVCSLLTLVLMVHQLLRLL